MTEKGKFSPHTLPISCRSPLQGCWLSLGIGRVCINPWQAPLSGLPSVITRHHRTTKLGSTFPLYLFCTCQTFNQSHTQAHCRVSLKKKKKGRKFVQWESRETKAFCLPCPYFVLKILDKPPKMIAYGERCWIWISEGENSASGPETWLQALRVSCGKSFITVKKI